MMLKAPNRLLEQGFPAHLPAHLGRSFGRQNLDAPLLTPYTSAVPEMDVNLNPRAAPLQGLTDGSGMEEDFRYVAAL